MSEGPFRNADESKTEDPDEGKLEVHLSEYAAVVIKRRALVAVVLAASLTSGILVSLLSKPVYRAVVTINVERDRGSVLDVGGSAPIADFYNQEFIPTQTRLMRSREISERVVRRLNLVANPEVNPRESGLAQKGSAKGTGDSTGASAARIDTWLALQVQRHVETAPIRGTNLVELAYSAASPKLAADIANAAAEAYIEWTMESKFRMVGQAAQFLGAQVEQLKAEIEEREAKLQAYGKQKDIVSTDPQANVTLQKLESLNKDYAASMADRVAREARYYELQSARAESIADTFAGGLVTALRNEQGKLERDYSEKLNLYKPEWPAMQQLKAQLEKGRQNLEAVIQETVTKARESARTEYQTALRREESLRTVLSNQKAEAMLLNSDAVEYNNLRVEVTTKRALLDALFKRQSETEVMSRLSGSRESSIRIVDRALPPVVRFSPSYKRNGLLALLLGLVGGVGLAFFFEYLDRSIRTVEQVERLLHLPALGVIPAIGEAASDGRYGLAKIAGYGEVYGYLANYGYGYGYGSGRGRKGRKDVEAVASPGKRQGTKAEGIELFPDRHPRSTVAECYRAFRNSLLLSRAGGVKTIVVTSGLPREGKTSTSVNLAIVLGQLGKRVLLIDGDLHKPRLHEALMVSNRVGVVSVLVKGIPAQDAVQRSNAANVSVMTAGPMAPNPSVLLTSDAMRTLICSSEREYDFVVIDTPPVLLVSDAMVLGHAADGVVLCVKGGMTNRETVLQARDRLRKGGAHILGVLINSLPSPQAVFGSHANGSSSYGSYGTYGSLKETAYGDDGAPEAAPEG